jgi:hypothetical protein
MQNKRLKRIRNSKSFPFCFLKAMREDTINLVKYMLVGAVGFGIGSLFPFNFYPVRGYAYPNIVEMLIFGAIGGISLGVMSKNTKKMLYLVLLGAIGISIGFIISFIFLYPIALLTRNFILAFFINFTLGGLVTGTFYGIALRNRKKIWRMAIAGGFGFAFGALFVFMTSSIIYGIRDMPLLFGVGGTSAYLIFGTITGMFLGLGMYCAEKQTTNNKQLVESESLGD